MPIRLSASAFLLFAISTLALLDIAQAQDIATPANNAATAPTSNFASVYDSADNTNRMTATRSAP